MEHSHFDYGIPDTGKHEATSIPELDPVGLNRTYGVCIKTLDGPKKKSQVHYEIEVSHHDTATGHDHLYRVNKKQVFIDEKPADGMQQEFAEACGQVFFPLYLEVDGYGEAVRIAKYHKIVSRWEKREKNLLLCHKSPAMTDQIRQRGQIIGNVARLQRALLHGDWFMELYFKGIPYGQVVPTCFLPLYPGGTIGYAVYRSFTTIQGTDKTNVLISGDYTQLRSRKDLLNGEPRDKNNSGTTGKLDIKYVLDKNTQIRSIVGKCNVTFPSGKSRETSIEIYHLKNKPPQTVAEKKAALEVAHQEEKKELKEKQHKKTYRLFGKQFTLGKNKQNNE